MPLHLLHPLPVFVCIFPTTLAGDFSLREKATNKDISPHIPGLSDLENKEIAFKRCQYILQLTCRVQTVHMLTISIYTCDARETYFNMFWENGWKCMCWQQCGWETYKSKEVAVLLREKHKGQNALHGWYVQFHKEDSKGNKQEKTK